MEKNKIIIESQLRSIIREELEKVLIEEGLAKQLQAALMALTLTFAGHQAAAGAGKGDGGSGGGQTIQQMLKDAGMKEDILKDLQAKLTKNDLELLRVKFEQQKRLHAEYDKAMEEGDTDRANKIDQQLDNLFAGVSSDAQKRLMQTGDPILQYIKTLKQNDIEQLGDLDETAIERLQSKALTHQMKPEVQTQNMLDLTRTDLENIAKIAFSMTKPEDAEGKDATQIILHWAVNDPVVNNKLPEEKFNLIDVIKAVSEIDEYKEQFRSKLMNSNYTDEKIDEFASSIARIPKSQIYASDIQKENKVQKLKKRLNELRGIYV